MDSYQSLFLIPFFFLLFFSSISICLSSNSAGPSLAPATPPESHSTDSSLSPDTSPSLQPVASPTPEPEPPISEVSFPPNSEPPSESDSLPPSESVDVSSSTLELESESLPPSESVDVSSSTSESDSILSSSLHSISKAIPGLRSISFDSTKANPAIKKICSSTDYPALCLSTIMPHLGGKTDIMSILGTSIRAGTKLTKFGIQLANRIASKPETPSDIVSILKDCKDSFDDAMSNFQEAADALPARDIGKMNTMLSAVITDIGDCEDEFSGQISPLAHYSEKVTKMASNCLAIVSLIPEHI